MLLSSRADSSIAAERLFDHDPGVARRSRTWPGVRRRRRTGSAESPGSAAGRVAPRAPAQLRECRAIVVVAVDVLEQFDQLGESGLVDAAVLFEAVVGPGLNCSRVQPALATPITGTSR